MKENLIYKTIFNTFRHSTKKVVILAYNNIFIISLYHACTPMK